MIEYVLFFAAVLVGFFLGKVAIDRFQRWFALGPYKPLIVPNDIRDYCSEYFDEHLPESTDEFTNELLKNCPCFGDKGDPKFKLNPDPWLESFCEKLNIYAKEPPEPTDVFLPLDSNTPDTKKVEYANLLLSSFTTALPTSDTPHDNPEKWITARIANNIYEKYKLTSFDKYLHGESVLSLVNRLNEHNVLRIGTDSARKTETMELFEDIFRHTGLFSLVENMSTPRIVVPQSLRMEHQWILGGSGSGKSTFLSAMLLQDLAKVEEGKASVVLLDSKRDLIKSIENLSYFAKGEASEGRLISIDVEDAARGFPIALNLMDLGASDAHLDLVDKESFRNSTLSMMNYFFESLLGSGSELTGRQRTVFNFLIQLMMEIPGANLDTLIDILEPGGLDRFQQYINKLPPDSQRYFTTQFDNDGKTRATKAELVTRIYAIKSNASLARLFSAKKTKLNLFDELSQGKVILINASKAILQDEVELFGRFMLAMILLAAERRQLIEKKSRLPTYVYMDEAHDIIKNDTRLPTILSQARAYNVGMVIAHQSLSQINNPKVVSALMANTAIKCTGVLSPEDAKRMAPSLDVDIQTAMNPPPHSFNVSANRVGTGRITPSNINFDNYPKMSQKQYQAFLIENRAKYAFAPEEPVQEPEKPEPNVYDIGGTDYIPAEEDIGELKDVAEPDDPLGGRDDKFE